MGHTCRIQDAIDVLKTDDKQQLLGTIEHGIVY